MNNKLSNIIEQEYKHKQWVKEDAKRKCLILARQNTEFKELDNKERALTLQLVNLTTENSNLNKDDLLKQINKIHLEKKAVFNKLKIKEKFNKMLTPSCPICNDQGKLANGTKCKCFKNRLIELMQEKCGIKNEKLRLFSDSNFDLFENKDEVKKIYAAVEKLINNFENTNIQTIVLQGKPGVGKTFLFSTIAGELISRGKSVFYLTSFNFNNLVLKYHTTFNEEKYNYISPLLETDALLIDDLGTEQILKNVTKEYLLMILKERNLNGLKTFVNTNLSPSEILDRYDERIYSRMFSKADSLSIKMDNTDLRRK